MSDQKQKPISQEQADALLLAIKQQDGHAYRTLADYHADVQNPMYETNEAWRDLVEKRLEMSPHLYQKSPHTVSESLSGGDVVCMNVSMVDGSVRQVEPGYTGLSSRSDQAREEQVELIETGSSTIINYATEGFEGGEE
jgi:hypothetical protein